MTIVIILLLVFGTYAYNQEKYYKHAYTDLLLLIVTTAFGTNVLNNPKNPDPLYAYIYFIIVVIGIVYFILISHKKPPKIVAKQVSFWDVPPEELIKKNKYRIQKKSGRNELVTIDIDENFINVDKKKNKTLSKQVFKEIFLYDGFTIINSLDFIDSDDCPILYKIIYNKLKEIKKDVEIDIDFDQTLKKNKFIIEFFFIECWEVLCKNQIIGTGTLDYYANSDRELELLGALDAIKSSNITKRGISLYSHYLKFKGLFNV